MPATALNVPQFLETFEEIRMAGVFVPYEDFMAANPEHDLIGRTVTFAVTEWGGEDNCLYNETIITGVVARYEDFHVWPHPSYVLEDGREVFEDGTPWVTFTGFPAEVKLG